MTTKLAVLFLAASLAGGFSAHAFLTDSLLQTIARYGQPVSGTGHAGATTSTRTFQASGLAITCGYIKGVVAMESYTRTDRAFMPPEVEALLRSNLNRGNWTPGQPYVAGTYHSTDGSSATVTDTQVVITTPQWTTALAQDKAAADKAAAAKAATAAQTNHAGGG